MCVCIYVHICIYAYMHITIKKELHHITTTGLSAAVAETHRQTEHAIQMCRHIWNSQRNRDQRAWRLGQGPTSLRLADFFPLVAHVPVVLSEPVYPMLILELRSKGGMSFEMDDTLIPAFRFSIQQRVMKLKKYRH